MATAVNCWVKPFPTFSVDGATSVVMSTMDNVSEPVTVVSAANVAVTVACEPAVAGAM